MQYKDKKNENDSIKVQLSDGTIVLMSFSDENYIDGPVSVQSLMISAKSAFRVITSISDDVKAQLELAKPDRASIEFSLELAKKGGDVFSKICDVSGKSGLKVKLEWDFKKNS